MCVAKNASVEINLKPIKILHLSLFYIAPHTTVSTLNLYLNTIYRDPLCLYLFKLSMRQFIRFFAASSYNHPTFSPLPSEIEKKEVKFSVLNNLYLTLLSAISDQRRLIKIKSAELKREVKRGLTFTLTSDLSCIASVLFANINFTNATHAKITRQWKSTLSLQMGLFFHVS